MTVGGDERSKSRLLGFSSLISNSDILIVCTKKWF